MLSSRKINVSGHQKLGEARFFLRLMEKSVENDAFIYFLSAFLSALYSVTEPVKLQPRRDMDDRYKKWKQQMDEGPLKDENLTLLRKMRNDEVHLIPPEKLQTVGASFGSEGIDLSGGGYVELDFRSGKPVGRHKVGDGPVETHPVTVSWHVDVPSNPDVLQTCRAGLAVVEQVIASRDTMRFDA
jgi:hypothetical protein